MDDKHFFLHYKQSFEVVFLANADDCIFIKDANLTYQAVTDKMVKVLGANSAKDILGKTTADLSNMLTLANSQLLQQLMEQDLRIQKTKTSGAYLEVLFCNGKNYIYIHYKTPIINPHSGNLVGIRGQLTNLLLPHVIKTLFRMHGTKGLLIGHKNNKDNPFEEYPLSSLQHMVLFLALNNHSYSEIAILLSEFGYQVTPIRVNDCLEQLKLIFHVRNKNQLIEKAIGLNLHTYLPGSLFNKLSSIEVSSEEAKIIYDMK